jgi:probable HAF family extracellular repeat protein
MISPFAYPWINASGQIIGWADLSVASSHAFLYSNGKMTDSGTLGGIRLQKISA